MKFGTLSPIRSSRDMRILSTVCMVALAALVLFHPDVAYASSGESMPWDSVFTKILNSITGPVAFVISTVAMVAFGIMMMFGGEMNIIMRGLLTLCLSISIAVFAKNFASTVFGIGASVGPMDVRGYINLSLITLVFAAGAIGMVMDVRRHRAAKAA